VVVRYVSTFVLVAFYENVACFDHSKALRDSSDLSSGSSDPIASADFIHLDLTLNFLSGVSSDFSKFIIIIIIIIIMWYYLNSTHC
jgi:hypothetical protein